MPQSAFVASVPNAQKTQQPPPNHLIPAKPTALPPQVSTQTAAGTVSTPTSRNKGKGNTTAAARSGKAKPAAGPARKASPPSTTPAVSKKGPAMSRSACHASSTSGTTATNRNTTSASKNSPAINHCTTSRNGNTPTAGSNIAHPPSATQNAVAAAQQAIAAAEMEAASEDNPHTSGQARLVTLIQHKNKTLRRELQVLRAQQEQSLHHDNNATKVLPCPRGEAGSRKKGFVLIEAMELDSTPQRWQFYNQILATVRRCIIQAQLPLSERFSSQDTDKIRNIIHLVRHEHHYLCQARFPGCWPVVKMIKLNLRNARKYRKRKDLRFDFDDDDEHEGSDDGDDSNIDPKLTKKCKRSPGAQCDDISSEADVPATAKKLVTREPTPSAFEDIPEDSYDPLGPQALAKLEQKYKLPAFLVGRCLSMLGAPTTSRHVGFGRIIARGPGHRLVGVEKGVAYLDESRNYWVRLPWKSHYIPEAECLDPEDVNQLIMDAAILNSYLTNLRKSYGISDKPTAHNYTHKHLPAVKKITASIPPRLPILSRFSSKPSNGVKIAPNLPVLHLNGSNIPYVPRHTRTSEVPPNATPDAAIYVVEDSDSDDNQITPRPPHSVITDGVSTASGSNFQVSPIESSTGSDSNARRPCPQKMKSRKRKSVNQVMQSSSDEEASAVVRKAPMKPTLSGLGKRFKRARTDNGGNEARPVLMEPARKLQSGERGKMWPRRNEDDETPAMQDHTKKPYLKANKILKRARVEEEDAMDVEDDEGQTM
ncbi:hypothetical protein H1R20_g8039, partial [Candolleomyces eurysporus]